MRTICTLTGIVLTLHPCGHKLTLRRDGAERTEEHTSPTARAERVAALLGRAPAVGAL